MHLSLFSFNAHDLSLSAEYMVQIDYVCKIMRLGITLELASELVLTIMRLMPPHMPRCRGQKSIFCEVPLSKQPPRAMLHLWDWAFV